MVRLFLSIFVLLMVAFSEGAPGISKKVQCNDKNFPDCFKKDLYCPDTCLHGCQVNCSSCQPVCITPPKPQKVKCKDEKFKHTCDIDLYCPAACPVKCLADCATCQAICPPSTPTPSYSPPPPVTTPSPTAPPPDSTEAAGGKRVRCKNKLYPNCFFREHQCPAACPERCEVDCVTCSPVCDCNKPGAVCQDPRFIGADGITFYFHGKKDREFCIVSDTNLHINAHFIGRRNENMGRDFTWVESLGILFDNHRILVGAKKTATWDDVVDRLELSYDGTPVYLSEGEGAKWKPESTPGISITRARDTNTVVVEVEGNFQIKAAVVPITEKDSKIHKYGITDEDCFAHLDLGFKFYSLSGEVNGVLGQTYASNYISRVKMGVDMPVLGGHREFASSSLFSTDCAAAMFKGTQQSSSNDFQYANMKCSSGLDGRGVVCKR